MKEVTQQQENKMNEMKETNIKQDKEIQRLTDENAAMKETVRRQKMEVEETKENKSKHDKEIKQLAKENSENTKKQEKKIQLLNDAIAEIRQNKLKTPQSPTFS